MLLQELPWTTAKARMNITSHTEILGVLGRGIAHTKSPLIHNLSIKLLNRDAIYLPFDLKHGSLPHTLETLWNLGVKSLNVTMPFKEEAARITSSGLTAVNTLFRGEGGWLGASTDGEGFFAALARDGFKLDDFDQIVFLGNGGAVVSLVEAIAGMDHKPRIVICRRSEAKDKVFSQLGYPSEILFAEFSAKELQKHLKQGTTLLVQATTAPLQGDLLQELTLALSDLKGYCFDLVYGTPSALIHEAKRMAIPHQDGLAMLVEQARRSQELWWGNSAPFAPIYDALAKDVDSKDTPRRSRTDL
jgi:shikimate dehydrogenase